MLTYTSSNKNNYLSLLENENLSFREEPRNYALITERHVQVMWLEQKYFSSLKNEDGDDIKIISPGIWNAETGPDFKKAHIMIGKKELYGDVEIHLSDDGWKQHNHHTDPNYNNVILHISLWKSAKHKEIITENQRTIYRSYLQDNLSIPEKRIIQLIDLDLYPYKKFCGSGHCANALFKQLPKSKIERFFREAAQWRLTKKRTHLQARVENPNLHLSAGIAMALGYKHNAEKFLDLFLYLGDYIDLPYRELLAKAMGRCGFFNEKFQDKWGKSKYYQLLRNLNTTNHKIELHLSNIRPINHPVRRIAFLVHMLKDMHLPNYFKYMEAHWKNMWPLISEEKDYKRIINELLSLLPTYTDNYWNSHYTFEDSPRQNFIPLVGNPLKSEILVNTFLPFLQESIIERGEAGELEAFYDTFAKIKAQESQKVKYLKHRFFGETKKKIY